MKSTLGLKSKRESIRVEFEVEIKVEIGIEVELDFEDVSRARCRGSEPEYVSTPESRDISRELNGRTRTATLTDDMAAVATRLLFYVNASVPDSPAAKNIYILYYKNARDSVCIPYSYHNKSCQDKASKIASKGCLTRRSRAPDDGAALRDRATFEVELRARAHWQCLLPRQVNAT
ncbi:hypothetical protein EVAR_103000_1 [Eumeta japonica]|uniref:Uncharacterized protein n=1 Tax=Eumeta variegata TaxID=151549 RepID=A0A4C1UQW9_EUMVA|nr:hypothetical protein EVAR_103000_1 [Eumeta japonica]